MQQLSLGVTGLWWAGMLLYRETISMYRGSLVSEFVILSLHMIHIESEMFMGSSKVSLI